MIARLLSPTIQVARIARADRNASNRRVRSVTDLAKLPISTCQVAGRRRSPAEQCAGPAQEAVGHLESAAAEQRRRGQPAGAVGYEAPYNGGDEDDVGNFTHALPRAKSGCVITTQGGIDLDTSVQSEIDLIGHIYDAVIEPDRWTDAIDRIRRHFGFHIAMLGVSVFPSGNVVIEASSNVPDYYVQSIKKFGPEALDLWGGAQQVSRLPSEEPLVYSQVADPKLRVGNPYYEEWAVPQGLADQVVVILENNPSMLATLGLGIHQSMPPISDVQVEGMRMLAPHLRRAVIISGLLESRAQAAASFEGVLSGLGSAVVLVDEFMQIIYANPMAEQMLQRGDPIVNLHGRLGVPHQLVAGQLEATVAAAVGGGAKLAQAGNGIAARRRDDTGVIVHVLPLQRRRERVGWRAVAAVFVAEPSVPIDLPVDAIKLLYGLRPAEARVFELIVAGFSGRHIAEALGIAPSTVKTHTLRLFDKLDTHSRAGVVKLAREMSFVAH